MTVYSPGQVCKEKFTTTNNCHKKLMRVITITITSFVIMFISAVCVCDTVVKLAIKIYPVTLSMLISKNSKSELSHTRMLFCFRDVTFSSVGVPTGLSVFQWINAVMATKIVMKMKVMS